MALAPLLLLPYSLESQALSATTSNYIHGTAPYLTFDGGATHADSISPLLSVTLPGNKIITVSNDSSSMENPLVLDKLLATFADIKTLVPHGDYPEVLTDKVIDDNGYWKDDDGDTLHRVNSSKLKIKWQNLYGQDITNYVKDNSDKALNGCDAPYQLTLEVEDVSIKTEYGIPSESDKFTGNRHTYYLYPKMDKPQFCYAMPNLEYDWHSNDIPYDGAVSSLNDPHGDWNKYRGFYAYNPANPGANFPTTGSHNLFFYLSVAGMKAQDIVNKNGRTISTGGVTLTLNAENTLPTGLVKINLTGPKESNPGSFIPSTFYLHDKNNDPLYSFRLERWYVTKKGGAGGYQNAVAFCNNFNGGGYRMTKVLDFTNARRGEDIVVDWQNGIADGASLRKISYITNGYWMGGLFSEWGRVTQIYYKDSDWEFFQVGDPAWGELRGYYWTSDLIDFYTRVVETNTGVVGARYLSDQDYRGACVTP
ncbi:hypothetical protein [Gilliamella sp. Imp1-1]|uniref:hypothetical protein n=1 Tax=Gilliamella sp. Imp1-1 TaxID=3120248 RepID=UPI0011478B69|nr:hypothetical protein [Gilliamella apicola]